MSDRTKGPWGRGDGHYSDLIVNQTGNVVCRCPNNPSNSTNWDADSAAIVRWENSHDDLVRALEDIAGQAVCEPMAGEEEVRRMLAYCRELADAALAKEKS
jgi:hypothetical protein